MQSKLIYYLTLTMAAAARLAMAVPAAAAAAAVPSYIPNPNSAAIADSNDPGIVKREDIPAGVEIRDIDSVYEERGEDETTGSKVSRNPAMILKRSDCNGSIFCGISSQGNCRNAYGVGVPFPSKSSNLQKT